MRYSHSTLHSIGRQIGRSYALGEWMPYAIIAVILFTAVAIRLP